MGRFSAAPRGAAFFLVAICSSTQALACEGCEPRDTARLDVTSAVDTAVSFVVATVRRLRPSYDVLIVENQSDIDTTARSLTASEYVAAYYDAGDGQPGVEHGNGLELPGFQHRYEWQLTYRDEASDSVAPPSQSESRLRTDVTLDDSWVFGLRFELDYGWKR